MIPPFAGINNDTRTVFYDDSQMVTDITSADNLVNLAWNAGGTQLAFITSNDNPQTGDFSGAVRVFDTATRDITDIHTFDQPTPYPVSWTQDGRVLFAARNLEANPETGLRDKVNIFVATIGDEPELLHVFTPGGECGGGSDTPSDWRYWDETNGFGGFFFTLAETTQGILYTTSCTGYEQALFNPVTGDSSPFTGKLSKVVVSPNRERIAAVKLNYEEGIAPQLAVTDLTTDEQTIVPTEGEPDQLTWNQDGTGIYYSLRTRDRDLMAALSDEARESLSAALNGYIPGELPAYITSVYYVDLATEENIFVYSSDVHAIGRMIETEDALYISTIANPTTYLDRLIAGDLEPQNMSDVLSTILVGVMRVERTGQIFGEASFINFAGHFTPYTGNSVRS